MMNKAKWNGMEIEVVSCGKHSLFSNSNGVFYANGINEHGDAVEMVFEAIKECANDEDGYGAYVSGNDVCVDVNDLLSDEYSLVDVY